MYQKIVVPLDGSGLAECVLAHVEALAKGCLVKNLVFIRVAEPFESPSVVAEYPLKPEDVARVNAERQESAKSYLQTISKRISFANTNISWEVLSGRAAESIVDYVTKNTIDLIVIATHGRSGVSRWVWGSVADRILRSACVPVLMVRAPGCFPGI